MRRAIPVVAVLFLSACSEHVVDSYGEWCEQISGVDLEEKYAPFWAVSFSVSFEGDAIRDDFVRFLDEAYMEKVERRPPQMAWREGMELHLVNLSSFFQIEPEEVIGGWQRGIEAAMTDTGASGADECHYEAAATLFDGLHIHSMESDAFGREWTDVVTIIPTERTERLGDSVL